MAQGVKIEDKQIKAVKNWPELTSIKDIQVFIGFANFYRRFLQGFSRIAAPLTSMLKTTRSSEELASKTFRADDNKVVDDGDGSKTVRNSSRKLTRMSNIGAIGEPHFLISDAKKAFNHLKLAFIEAQILQHFDPESHVRIETNASSYAIGGILSQLNLDSNAPPNDLNLDKSDFSQWHPVAYFSRKMIFAETQYKTHNTELLTIVEVFKTWHYYLEGCKHEVLVLTDYNNLRWFMDTKNLSFRQVRWAQKLSKYYFRINYCQSKPIELQTPYLAFPRGALIKKKSFKPKILKFFIICSPSLRGPAFQASASAPTSYRRSTESSSTVLTFSPSCVIFGTRFEPN